MRSYDRSPLMPRPIKITPNYLKHALSSVLIEQGDTKVICSVNVEESLPGWLRQMKPPQGWLTSEYAMLPAATHQRTKRERQGASGRSQEIQRLIGRSLRGIIDLNKCPEISFMIDCDVIQADGGTRTASITGAFVALKIAVEKLKSKNLLKSDPITDGVAAISIGLKEGQLLVDLDYKEDSSADVDMNVVMTHSGRILELQGTAERKAFTKTEALHIMDAAENSLKEIFKLQEEAIRMACKLA